jgi:hypothetical protein
MHSCYKFTLDLLNLLSGSYKSIVNKYVHKIGLVSTSVRPSFKNIVDLLLPDLPFIFKKGNSFFS